MLTNEDLQQFRLIIKRELGPIHLQLRAVQTRIADMQEQIEILKQEVTDIRKDILGLKQNVTELQTDVTSLKKTNIKIKKDIHAIITVFDHDYIRLQKRVGVIEDVFARQNIY